MRENINKENLNREEIMLLLKDTFPDFYDYLKKLLNFHKTREQLSSREREIAILASLITQGSPERQIKIHIQESLKAGLTKSEITEIIMQISLYSGMPSSINALIVLSQFGEYNEC